MAKKLVLGPILAHLAQIRAASFFVFCCFFKNLPWSVTIYHGQLSSCTISKERTKNHPTLRKLSDGRTDRQTDRQTDDIYFIGRYPTNVERPT